MHEIRIRMRQVSLFIAILVACFLKAQPCAVSISGTNASCAGIADGTVTVTVIAGGPYTYTWGHDPALNVAAAIDLGPDIYTVQVTDGVCDTLMFYVVEEPGITILGVLDYCPSSPPLLTALPTGGFQPDVYAWSTLESTVSIQIPAGTEGTIDLIAVDTVTLCQVTAQVELTELPSPIAVMATPDTTCQRVLTLVNTVSTNADSLVWRWAGGGFSNQEDPLIAFDEAGWQFVSLQPFDSLGCGGLAMLDSIYAQPQVPAVFSVAQVPCTPTVDVVLGSFADSCAFFIGDSLWTNDCNGFFNYNNRRYVEVTYTLYATQANGCNDTLEVVLDIRTEPTLFYANAFTPNEDGINDFWPVRIDHPDVGFDLRLYDRWGTQIWSTTDPEDQWDGELDGGQAPLGVYVYQVRRRDPCEPSRELVDRGHVTVFR